MQCYCCSCYYDHNDIMRLHDPACRNHGFDGQRPCETHDNPGYITELSSPGIMPDSVQKKRAEDAKRFSEIS